MDRLGIPRWWLPWLGAGKAVATVGLIVGLFGSAVGYSLLAVTALTAGLVSATL
jgi:hypothetical protein